MDILTKIKVDHSHIHTLLQQIMAKVKEGNKTNVLLEDFLEEMKEHIQAEQICLSEMFLEKEKQTHQSSSQINKESVFELFSNKLYQEFDKISGSHDLENKLKMFEKLFQDHSHTIENVITLLSQECINDQRSEELSLKFEQEKLNTLRNSITYA